MFETKKAHSTNHLSRNILTKNKESVFCLKRGKENIVKLGTPDLPTFLD